MHQPVCCQVHAGPPGHWEHGGDEPEADGQGHGGVPAGEEGVSQWEAGGEAVIRKRQRNTCR